MAPPDHTTLVVLSSLAEGSTPKLSFTELFTRNWRAPILMVSALIEKSSCRYQLNVLRVKVRLYWLQ